MQRARILAAALYLTASGGTVALAFRVLHEGDAFAGSPRALAPGAVTRKGPSPRDTKLPFDRAELETATCAAKVRDGHSGELRCVLVEDLATKGSTDPTDEAADAGPRLAKDASPPGRPAVEGRREGVGDGGSAVVRSVSASVEGMAFENGDVPRAAAALDRMRKEFARCAVEGQGPLRNEAAIDLRFLVRAPGRAEGVDVVQVKGVSADVAKCVASVLTNRPVGAPSDDPVGVSITLRFKKD